MQFCVISNVSTVLFGGFGDLCNIMVKSGTTPMRVSPWAVGRTR